MRQATTPSPPDFYYYPWISLDTVVIDGDFVYLHWPDGSNFRAFTYWLRENAMDCGGIDPATREGLMDPAEFVEGLCIGMAEITPDGALKVCFEPEGVSTEFHPGWLHHVANSGFHPNNYIDAPKIWTSRDLAGNPPDHDGSIVLENNQVLRDWTNDLLRFGIARLSKAPTNENFLLDLAARIGVLRDTNFGPIWDVKADITLAGDDQTNSTANTNLRLPPHTDLPTRETPPGFQLLHCVENTAEGGYSTMADGAAVVAHIRANEPAHYEALTTLRWVFFNRGPNIDHRWSAPLIDTGNSENPLILRAFHPVRAFPDMPEADIPRAYAALAYFSRTAALPKFQLRFPFSPGDVIGFDNHRILHGREAFSVGGTRHLRGIYIDHDEIRSFARVNNRRVETVQT